MNAEEAARTFTEKIRNRTITDLRFANVIGNCVFVKDMAGDNVFMFYDTVAPDADEIRSIFNELAPTDYACIILSKDLVPKEGEEIRDRPDWMRVLHAMFYGQVYFYLDNGEISSFHLEKNPLDETWVCQWNPYRIDPTKFRVDEHECWADGWDDLYRTVMFKSKSWWKERDSQSYQSRRKEQRGSTHGYTYEDFKRDFRKQHTPNKWEQYMELLGVKVGFTQDELKKAWREKAKQFHPDLNKAPDATEKMQAINAAFDYLKV